jgi:DNA helicase II / ATP-dependent DNA helicase PcrA
VLGARVAVDLDGAAQRQLMRRALDEAGVFAGGLKPARGSDPAGAFLGALTLVRAALRDPGELAVQLDAADGSTATLPFAAVHDRYLQAQTAAGRQSFDDQIWFAVADMLAEPARRRSMQELFAHVLVDEFQDLNGAQLALVDVLSRPHRRLFVVGDDDQLIYGWRHADPRGILEFHARVPPPPHSATYVLETNYRCSRAVVEAGARLVANNTVREVKHVRPRAGAQDGALRFAGALSWPERTRAVCAFLVAERARLGCSWRELAVLCRYRSQKLLAALALDDAGIPRTPTLGCTLFTHPAAELLRGYVDMVASPDGLDGVRLAALLNRPNRYIRGALVEEVAAAAQPWAAAQAAAARESRGGAGPLARLIAQVEWLQAALREADAERPLTAAETLWAVVDEFGLEAYWKAGDEQPAAAGRDGAGPLQVVDALLLLAETYPEPRVFFAAWDRLKADEEAHEGVADDSLAREEAGEDRVVIGTIHAAKGREYHSVVIPDYDCDVSRWQPPEIEEERRVVYVGVTRAREAALFTVDTSRPYIHPFLRELVETPDADEHASLRAWRQEEPDADLRRRIGERLEEIEILFPETVPPADVARAEPDDGRPGSAGQVEELPPLPVTGP